MNTLGSGTSYAAGYCNAYRTSGVSGWCLPAQGELYASIVTNYSAVSKGISAAGGTQLSSGYWYWSSSESSTNLAWNVYANDGTVYWNYKDAISYVVCVLAF